MAIDYVRAFLGHGNEMFGFKHYLEKNLPSFPVNTMDLLLYHLKMFSEKDEKCKENYQMLSDTIDVYLKNAHQITLEGMVQSSY